LETKEWRFIDKKKWGDGPSKLPCLIVRSIHSGALCGYVAVSKKHKWYGKCYDPLPVAVHGGLTFGDACAEDKEHGVCHIVGPDEDDDVFWFGFDCAHGQDFTPGFESRIGHSFSFPGSTYKDIDYVKKQIRKLAKQLK